MQTQTVVTYSFDELPIETQEKIADSWRNDDYFSWGDEWQESLHRFADYFDLDLKKWSVDHCFGSYVKFEFKEDCSDQFWDDPNSLVRSDISGVRLYKMLLNRYFFFEVIENKDCPFTGFCGDESLLEPIREFIKRPCKYTSFYELIDECFDNWIREFKADIEHWESFDCIKEEILANDYQFTYDGRIFKG